MPYSSLSLTHTHTYTLRDWYLGGTQGWTAMCFQELFVWVVSLYIHTGKQQVACVTCGRGLYSIFVFFSAINIFYKAKTLISAKIRCLIYMPTLNQLRGQIKLLTQANSPSYVQLPVVPTTSCQASIFFLMSLYTPIFGNNFNYKLSKQQTKDTSVHKH